MNMALAAGICHYLFVEHLSTWFTLSSAELASLIKLKNFCVLCLSLHGSRWGESLVPPVTPAPSLEHGTEQDSVEPVAP